MKILIVKLSSLGDILHALPAVHGLRTGLGARIDWLVQHEYVDLVSRFSDVERVLGFPRRRFLRGLTALWHDLRREQYDMVVDLQGLLKSAVAARAARATRRIGPSFHREGSRLFYTEVAGPRARQRHAVDQIMDVLDHLGLPRPQAVFPIHLNTPTLDSPHPRLAICPVSRWESKNWPMERFVKTGRAFCDARGGQVFVLGGPGDVHTCQVLADGIGRHAINLAGQTSLVELAGTLAAMDVVLTNDSGPMHLAAAVGTPTVALFGPTDPRRTGPYGPGHTVLEACTECRPCTHRTCRRTPSCMSLITVDSVLDALGVTRPTD